MSMPTVRSSIVSCSQMARAIASRSASVRSSCSCSSSKSCMRVQIQIAGPIGSRRLDDAGQRLGRQRKNRRLVEDVAHLATSTPVSRDRFEPFAVDARILILVLDLAAALLHGNRAAAFGALAPQRDERIAPAAEAAGEIARRLGAGVEMLVEHPERRRVHEAVLPGKFLEFANRPRTTAANSPRRRPHAHACRRRAGAPSCSGRSEFASSGRASCRRRE